MIEFPFLETENENSSADIDFATGGEQTRFVLHYPASSRVILQQLCWTQLTSHVVSWRRQRSIDQSTRAAAAALNAENWTAPGFSTGNAAGRCTEGSESSFESDVVASSSEIAESMLLLGFRFSEQSQCTFLHGSTAPRAE